MVYQDPITPTSGFYRSLAVGTIGRHDRRGRDRRLRRHRASIRPASSCRATRRCRPTAPACSRRSTPRPPRSRRYRPVPACASSTSPSRSRPTAPRRAGPGRRRRRSDDHRLRGSPPTSRRATARHPSSACSIRVHPFSPERRRPRRRRARLRAPFTESVAWTLRSRTAAAPSCSTRPAPARPCRRRGTASSAGHRRPRRRLHRRP